MSRVWSLFHDEHDVFRDENIRYSHSLFSLARRSYSALFFLLGYFIVPCGKFWSHYLGKAKQPTKVAQPAPISVAASVLDF